MRLFKSSQGRQPFGTYIKLSCSALLISSVFVNYSSIENVHAETAENQSIDENHHKISQWISDAKQDINELNALNDSVRKQFEKQLDEATSRQEIKQIVADATDENQAREDSSEADNTSSQDTKHSAQSTTTTDITAELDKILANLNAVVDKDITDTPKASEAQRGTKDNEQYDASKVQDKERQNDQKSTTVLDDLAHIKDHVKQADSAVTKDDKEQTEPNNKETKSNQQQTPTVKSHEKNEDQLKPQHRDANHSTRADKAIDSAASKQDTNSTHLMEKLDKQLTPTEKIEAAVTKVQNDNHHNNKDYADKRLNQLATLKENVANRVDIAQDKKKQIITDIERAANKTTANRQIIQNDLAQAEDKEAVVKDIVTTIFSPNEAQQILKNMSVKGKTDKEIADQLLQHIDKLALTSSDDILASMFDQTKDKPHLIETILGMKLSPEEAKKAAQRLTNAKLSNKALVQQLKKEFGLNGKANADDILQSILDQSTNQKEAIKTILATKINEEKARLLADVISRVSKDKKDVLQLVKSALNGKADDLLQLKHRLDQAQYQADDILAPIKNRPSLLDRLHADAQRHRSVLDQIDDIPNPTQGLSLGHINNQDNFLSGLFDDNGSLSLPASGQVLKTYWPVLAIGMILIGGGLLLLARTRKQHNAKS